MRYSIFVAILGSMLPLPGHVQAASHCLPAAEFEPHVVHNFGNKVSFDCAQAAPFDLIRAVGYQTRLPIGVEVGVNADVLFKPIQTYHLSAVEASAALAEAARNTGFSLREEQGVFILRASDLSFHQRNLLEHRFSIFKVGPEETMAFQGATLTASLRDVVDPSRGTGGSISGSTNDEHFTLQEISNATADEIADRIVRQGSRGMWVFRAGPSPSSDLSTIEMEIWPYQHFTNMPLKAP